MISAYSLEEYQALKTLPTHSLRIFVLRRAHIKGSDPGCLQLLCAVISTVSK